MSAALLRPVARQDGTLTVRCGAIDNHLWLSRWSPPGESRGTVVCVHGYGCTRLDFEPLAEALARRGLVVVAADMPGHGRSTITGGEADLGPDGACGTINVARCLAALVQRHAPDPASRHLIGTSWGAAMVASFLAALRLPARRVLLNDLVLEWHPQLRTIYDRLQADGALRFPTIDEAVAHLERRERELFRQHDGARIEPSLLRRYLESRLAVRADGVALASDPTRHGAPRLEPSQFTDYQALLPTIAAERLLLLFGGDSPFRETAMRERLLLRLPNLRCAEVPAAGHAPRLLTPAEWDLVGRFLLAP
jgi:pimeloyl-ACP methyl ester carboxylesterase